MWFEHNDMEDLERLLREQKEKDDKVWFIINSLNLFPCVLSNNSLLSYMILYSLNKSKP